MMILETKYFYQSNELKGIFGLGEDVKEMKEKLRNLLNKKRVLAKFSN